MRFVKNKASIFIYTLILINISLVIGYVVYNNTYILDNNINIGKKSEKVVSKLLDKANLNIETVRKYNSNGGGFLDGISCPTSVTMSGTTSKSSGISTNIVYHLGNIYCSGDYLGEEFRIYFNSENSDFDKVYFKGEMVDLEKTSNTNISVGTTNLSLSSTIEDNSQYKLDYVPERAKDGSTSSGSYFDTVYRSNREWVRIDLGLEKGIGKIVLQKEKRSGNYWNNGYIVLEDSGFNEVDRISLSGMKNDEYREINLKYRGLVSDVRYVTLETNNKYLDISELEIYELLSTGGEEKWQGVTVFGDSDNTLISFTSDGIFGDDGIDDDLNSDNYKVTSIGDVYFPAGYQDDDVIPRLTIFGGVKSYSGYENIFWNNYLTNEVIENNTNNDDILNLKASQADSVYMYIDIFSKDTQVFDIKLLEFDSYKYKNEFTLFPIKSYEGTDLVDSVGYLQLNGNELSLSKEKTGNEMEFDLKNKDYGIFIKNKSGGELLYKLTAETGTGKMIYINPIDDSKPGEIEFLSNYITIGLDKNFVGENLTVVGNK